MLFYYDLEHLRERGISFSFSLITEIIRKYVFSAISGRCHSICNSGRCHSICSFSYQTGSWSNCCTMSSSSQIRTRVCTRCDTMTSLSGMQLATVVCLNTLYEGCIVQLLQLPVDRACSTWPVQDPNVGQARNYMVASSRTRRRSQPLGVQPSTPLSRQKLLGCDSFPQ